MGTATYAYSGAPTRNPFRFCLALWRVLTWKSDDAVTEEAAIVEIGFARSSIGRRLARWNEVLDRLRADPRTAGSLQRRQVLGPLNLDALAALPAGSLGHAFAEHCRTRGIEPNLVDIPPVDEEAWLLNHLFQTHDIWHVVTGWPNDANGEVGLGGFYCGQLGSPAFFAFMLGLIILKSVFRKERTSDLFEAFVAGYRSGQTSEPLFGANWNELWASPMTQVREQFGIKLPDQQPSAVRVGALAPAL